MNNTLYIKSTDDLRPFLELAGYGCYSRQQMKQLLEKAGTYDKRIEFLNVCLSTAHWHYARQGKERRFAFHGDAYHTLHNYLAPIFAMKSMDIQWLLCYIMILLVLNQPENKDKGIPYSTLEKDVIQKLYDLLLPHLKGISFVHQADWKKKLAKATLDDKETVALALQLYHESWASQIRRRAREMAEAGLILSQRRGKELWYRLTLLKTDLTLKERYRLAQSISFCSAVSLLRLPGCYLLQRFKEYVPPCYQVHHNRLLAISNDPQLYILLKALQQGKAVAFSYRGSPKTGLPLDVWVDAYQREYVHIQEDNQCASYRIHRMAHIQILSATIQRKKKKRPKMQQLALRIYATPDSSCERTLQKIRQRFPQALFTVETENTIFCQLETPDGLALLPWLRTLHPAVELISESTGKLRNRLKKDFEEALRHYE